MLLQLEQECLDVYKRKLDQAAKSRAHLLQILADSKAELSRFLFALGEPAHTDIVSVASTILLLFRLLVYCLSNYFARYVCDSMANGRVLSKTSLLPYPLSSNNSASREMRELKSLQMCCYRFRKFVEKLLEVWKGRTKQENPL